MVVRRLDIFYANIPCTTDGSVQRGERPVLIIQNNIGNTYSPTVIVAPITRKKKKPIQTHLVLCGVPGLDDYSTVLFEQITTISMEQLTDKVGFLPEPYGDAVRKCINISLGLE